MKNQQLSKKKILKAYTKHVTSKGKRPQNIEKFCRKNGFSLVDFQDHFKKIEHIERHFWKQLFHLTDRTLAHEQIENSTHQLLSFYYTLFENMNLNRGFIYFIEKNNNPLCLVKQLKKAASPSLKNLTKSNALLDKLPFGLSDKIQTEALFTQFLTIYKFWKNDHTEDKEATDAFIEKSVKLAHDLSHALPYESIFDYSTFLFKNMKKIV